MADTTTPGNAGSTPNAGDEELDLGEDLFTPDEDHGESPEGVAYDDSDIPPELKPKWEEHTKGYKAAFTRKTQELAEQKKQLEARLKDLGQVEYKSRLFDQLVSNPDVQEALYAQRQAGLPQGQAPASTDGAGSVDSDPRIVQMQQVINSMQRQLQTQQVQREVEAFKAQNPNWARFQEGMNQAWIRNPQLRPQEAYDLAVLAASRARAAERARKPAAPETVERPQTGVRTQETGDFDSIGAAFQAALRKHGVQ